MNEVTQIHLGRTAYTIAADAHTTLRAYLNAIKKAVGDDSVVEEVELRMAELLAEHGISGEKVILPEDVDFLKTQLGDPKDFSENDEDISTPVEPGEKRFFRDTDNAIVAGVAAGLANYFNIDVVIIRILFILLTFMGAGAGIVIYVVLWLAFPTADTASERLQMLGKPVNLDTLKEAVASADLPGKTRRVSRTFSSVVNTLFRAAFKLVGAGFIAGGVAVILAIVTIKTYMLAHDGRLFQENLFPVGLHEQLLVMFTLGLLAIVAMFLILAGITAFKRKWPVRGWITAILIGLFMVGTAVTGALAADAVPHVRDRYETITHTTAVHGIQPFTNVQSDGSVDLTYISSPDYAVNVHYVDHPDLSKLKIYVKDGTLHVDSTQLDGIKHCDMLCLFPGYDMTVQIYSPNVEKFTTPPHTDIFYPNIPPIPAKD